MSAAHAARFDKFEPDEAAFARTHLARYAAIALRGCRTWCHTLRVHAGEVGHVHYAAGTQVAACDTGGLTIVFRLGGVRRENAEEEPAVFHEFALYPDGAIPASHYVGSAHEFVLISTRTPVSAAAGQRPLPPLLIEQIWRLILRLRETGNSELCQAHFDAVVEHALASAACELAPPLLRAQRLLEADWDGGRSSSRVAAQAGVSTAYLCRLFKSGFGTSISHYQRLIRLSRAAGLLWGSCLPIDAVAAVCGFADQSHLTRQMLELFALTPLVFRRLAPCLGKDRLAHIDFLAEPMALVELCSAMLHSGL